MAFLMLNRSHELGNGVGAAAPKDSHPVPAINLLAADRDNTMLYRWAQRHAGKYGIPVRALQAYGYATVVLARAKPDCHLGWTTLAGIAQIESDHGRFRGAKIAADGLVRPPIRGVPLDGTNGNARITDTNPEGRSVYARASGPFQFIPDTWKRWGIRSDLGYDAVTRAAAVETAPKVPGNPDDIDDAALAAGRYLCASGGNLSTYSGWRKAIFAYNHSEAYVRNVHQAADTYTK
ncbi:murein transglycosylase [Nocardia sp. NPDC050435]|uniref:murein transglycosylase n=1 Tax=Nocardia sp. NPDC050435 TaxID=3155040 RepID=UPI0033CAB786